jgi:hypothetical protein
MSRETCAVTVDFWAARAFWKGVGSKDSCLGGSLFDVVVEPDVWDELGFGLGLGLELGLDVDFGLCGIEDEGEGEVEEDEEEEEDGGGTKIGFELGEGKDGAG